MIQRGAIVVTALPGEYGKPRPAVVVQSNLAARLSSYIVCPLTTYEEGSPELRPAVDPTTANGLERRSFVMVDKIIAMPAAKLQQQIGMIEDETMTDVSRVLSILLGL